MTVNMDIRIDLAVHAKTRLLLATSEDLRGLMVAGRSEEQIIRELPEAIREVLEAEGKHVVSVAPR